jgi:hypothetical protein
MRSPLALVGRKTVPRLILIIKDEDQNHRYYPA